MSEEEFDAKRFGLLAWETCGLKLRLEVLKSAGCGQYYIGTRDEEGPVSRESNGYWPTRKEAEDALHGRQWPQKPQP